MNSDSAAADPPSTIGLYAIAPDGSLHDAGTRGTDGIGVAGGFFGIDRVLAWRGGGEVCLFASNAQSETIAAFAGADLHPAGVFSGSHADSTLAPDGIGLAADATRLYASFTGAGTMATFRIGAGCTLRFLGDVAMRGLAQGTAEGFAVGGGTMIVTYGDGSAETFSTRGDLPTPRHDSRLAADPHADFAPGSIVIAADGCHAILTGGTTTTTVQVATLADTRLTLAPPVTLGTEWGAGAARLAPDGHTLVIAASTEPHVAAARFNPETGAIQPGCETTLQTPTPVTALGPPAFGPAGTIYVPELTGPNQSYIATLTLTQTQSACTLRERPGSPLPLPRNAAVLSLGLYSP